MQPCPHGAQLKRSKFGGAYAPYRTLCSSHAASVIPVPASLEVGVTEDPSMAGFIWRSLVLL